jgi:phosphatidylserine decarboxylase
MAKTIEEWLDSDVAELEELSLEELGNTFFFRDPMRPNFIDNEHFYSPADGVILYQKIVEADEPVVEIKGKNYKLKDVLGDPTYTQKSLVVGIFMTFYSVHINRVPYSGILKYEKLEPIESTNQPMLAVEKDILKKTINPKNMFKYIN